MRLFIIGLFKLLDSNMYQVLIRVVARYAPIVTLPVAVVLGFIGYTLESQFSSRNTPSLGQSINEQREDRLINEDDALNQKYESKSKTIFDKNDPSKLKH
jgi:hypothetical protein